MKQNSFNQTAFRILLLLLWLNEKPLTFQEINERFKETPSIRKKVSQDSLWLYINTLKILGCEVSRPAPRNGFRYALSFHPFSCFLTSEDVRILRESLAHMDECLDFWGVVHFNKWLRRIFHHASNRNREDLSSHFFSDSRTSNFDTLEQLIRDIEHHCNQNQLLSVNYHSPLKGFSRIDFLPHKLFHHQGTLYLLGHSADQDQSSMLRLDRIESVRPMENPSLHKILLLKQMEKQVFIIRLFQCSGKQYDPLGEDDELLTDPTSPEDLLIKVKTNNPFLLKQKLLSASYLFQVIYPKRFRQEMHHTLQEMRKLYVS